MPSIRNARASDAPAIADLLKQLGYSVSPEILPARLAALDAEGGVSFVATGDDDRVVGVASAARHTTLHAGEQVGYITSLVTDQTARRSGIGRALVAAIERWATDHGCARLSVTSAEHRADAHAFYPSCGFPYSGRRFTKALGEPAS